MKTYIGSATVGKDRRIQVPMELMRELEVSSKDKLIFTKMDCGIVITNNEVP